MITFTGSRETGVAVTKAAADHLKHVHLELGGKNAIIVMDDADLDLAVDGHPLVGVRHDRPALHRRVARDRRTRRSTTRSQSKLVARAERLRLGPGWEHDTDVGPVINQRGARQDPRATRASAATRAPASSPAARSRPTATSRRASSTGRRCSATSSAQMRIAQEEIFGPTTALIRVRDFDEAVAIANGISYGLSSSIFTRDVNTAFRAMRDLAGRHHLHQRRHDRRRGAPPVRRHEGHRQRPPRGGQAALDVFTEWKSIYVDYSGKLQRAQIETGR